MVVLSHKQLELHGYLKASAPDARNDPITTNNVIGSVISQQLTISRSHRIPRMILFRLNHDPADIKNLITFKKIPSYF